MDWNLICSVQDHCDYCSGYKKRKSNNAVFIVRKNKMKKVFGYNAMSDRIITNSVCSPLIGWISEFMLQPLMQKFNGVWPQGQTENNSS